MQPRGDRNPSTEALALAWSFGWPIAASALLGYWLDGLLGSDPWLTLLFAVGAMVAGVKRILILLDRNRR